MAYVRSRVLRASHSGIGRLYAFEWQTSYGQSETAVMVGTIQNGTLNTMWLLVALLRVELGASNHSQPLEDAYDAD